MTQATYDLGYTKAHREIKRVRGVARDHRCILCSKRAQQWAYDHLDPDEIPSRNGAYSRDVTHYVPMCASCHRLVDMSRIFRKNGVGWESEICPIAERDEQEDGGLQLYRSPRGHKVIRR